MLSDSTPTPKSKIEEAISKLDETSLALATAFACLLLCKESGRLEEAIAALEKIADGQS